MKKYSFPGFISKFFDINLWSPAFSNKPKNYKIALLPLYKNCFRKADSINVKKDRCEEFIAFDKQIAYEYKFKVYYNKEKKEAYINYRTFFYDILKDSKMYLLILFISEYIPINLAIEIMDLTCKRYKARNEKKIQTKRLEVLRDRLQKFSDKIMKE
jgi:hypothetical protein